MTAPPAAEGAASEPGPGSPPPVDGAVAWLADYVYGTISTLVALAGLTFETNPEALTSAGVVVVGAVAIWLAHSLARLVPQRSWQRLELRPADVLDELRASWTILLAAVPSSLIFLLAGLGLYHVSMAFVLADVFGVLGLAVVGFGTAGRGGPWSGRRLAYGSGLVLVGAAIVGFESLVHLL